jgi:uncharacterized protein
MMIRRDLYLNQLFGYIDKPLIKVITGIRRSGKSAILKMLRDELTGKGIDEENIIYLNFESFEFSEIDRTDKLYDFIKGKIRNKKRYYILLDEIQEVESWEKAVNSFLVDFDADIYITGSNSRLLSSELATYLTGRYIEIHLYTLSFSEYILFREIRTHKKAGDLHREFSHFLQMGGFPVLSTGEYNFESAYKVVFDIYSSAILRDTVQRHNIRDVELLERVVRYVFDNVGNKFSAKNVADYFKSQQRRIDLNTVYNYIAALEGAFIVYRIPRYDVRGKEILKTFEKYFVADQSLLYAVMGYKERLISGILENIVMLELKRRGYMVFVGKSDNKEIDFIAEMKGEKIYIQVAYRMSDKTTIEREFSSLRDIKDNYPKYVVTMDETWQDNIEGIQQMHIADFLVLKEY